MAAPIPPSPTKPTVSFMPSFLSCCTCSCRWSCCAMITSLFRSGVEQGQTPLGVDLPPDGPGIGVQHQLDRGADLQLEHVPAAGRAVPQAEGDVDVEERLASVEGEVAG